jgi:hypothetical protein
LKKEFDWLLGKEFQKLRDGFEPVDNREFLDEDKHGDEDPTKGKATSYTNIFSLEQVSTFWQRFGDLEDAEGHLNPGMEVDSDRGEQSGIS